MKQNRVYVIYKKLFTTVKELKLYVASCRVRSKKLNKKMFKKKIKTTHEFNDYILKKEKI